MDGSDAILPETDITEALYAQQQLLQQLHAELDAEREASETAASEALSMILRLQGEKASLKMEACQYKRMAEEKMDHAEEALAIFEDLIYQREMEIASLEFQVQAYRHRLLSMGCNDLCVYENKFPENLLMQRTDTLSGEKGVQNGIRRMSSLPIQIKDSNQSKRNNDKRRSAITSPDSITSIIGESASQEVKDSDKRPGSSSAADLNYYWEQIKKLDDRVKEISDNKDPGRNRSGILRAGSWSPSLFSQASIGTSVYPTRGTGSNNPDQVKNHDNSQEKLALHNSTSSSTVQDIFEVPSTAKTQIPCVPRKKECAKSTVEGGKKLEKPDAVGEEALKPPNKDEKGPVKTMSLSTSHEKKLPKPRGGMMAEGILSPVQQAVGAANAQAEYHQLRQRVELLERTRNSSRQEITAAGNEELGLLKEINEQLKSLQSEIRSMRTNKQQQPTRSDEPSLDLLSEAMIYFWM